MNALPLKRRSIRRPIAPPHHVSSVCKSKSAKGSPTSPPPPIWTDFFCAELGAFYCKVLNHADSGDSFVFKYSNCKLDLFSG